MNITTNPELDLAYNYVQHTNQNIFLTGKAGTGKTTFLHRVKKESGKRIAIVAPTGIAAINARGMTIHSFFQLPFGPHLPNNKNDPKRQRNFSGKKISLIKNLELLIIDEISMVRADLLDGIDEVLRRYKDYTKPFGGIQLLMIGDLHQLPPVVTPKDKKLLREYYQTFYFFGSHALKKTNPVTIELKKIYRQSDDIFINLLNKVRENKLDKPILDILNSRYIANFQPAEDDNYITLTSHNAVAKGINTKKLASLSETLHRFKAIIKGKFPEHAYPTEELLDFKVGAQVLFTKNDISSEKRYYNGKIGQITKIEKQVIYVKCPNEPSLIAATMVDWQNVKYTLNETTKQVTEEVIGTFTQLPLKLAWAITIHKSQGLTFERAIIDAADAFSHGQVYVALSRCKSFEGIVLRSKIGYQSVKTDIVVKDYSEEAEQNAPSEADLQQSKYEYQQALIEELFSFKLMKNAIGSVKRIYLEYEKNLSTAALHLVSEFADKIAADIFSIAAKFQPQLQVYFVETELPEENEKLQTRIKKASIYFAKKLNEELLLTLQEIPVSTDNQAIKKSAIKSIKTLEKEIFVKQHCFEIAQTAFSVVSYRKAKTVAALDFKNLKKQSNAARIIVPVNTLHPALYTQLVHWRKEVATKKGLTHYDILPSNSLQELVQYLPRDMTALKRIKGVGAVKSKMYGAAIITMIEDYCKEKGIEPKLLASVPKKAKLPDTAQIASLNSFKAGKNVLEIAKKRGLSRTTIEGHLTGFITAGKLDIFEVIARPKVEEMELFFTENKPALVSKAKTKFGNKYAYGELVMVLNYLKSKERLID